MNKVMEPGGRLVYSRGAISLRAYENDGFLGLWLRSYEVSEEGDKYSAHSLIEVFDSFSAADAIEAAVEAAKK